MSFNPKAQDFAGARKDATIQMLHTNFAPTIPEAIIDLREKEKIMRAYGDVIWLSVDLYRVSGVGRHSNKRWKLLGEYEEPDDVPGF